MSDDDSREWQRKENERRAAERKARDEAIEKAYEAANEEWKEDALEAARWCAERFVDFIQQAVWDRLTVTTKFQPREKRCMAGVLLRAKSNGWIASTKERRQSPRPGCHLNEVMVWRSCIYASPPREPTQEELLL